MCGGNVFQSHVMFNRRQAPERISNQQYGYAADIWSIGLTLLAVVFGRYPLGPDKGEIGGYWEFLRLICDEAIPMPNPRQYSRELIDVLGCCLKKDPTDRISLEKLRSHPFLSMTGDVNDHTDSPTSTYPTAMTQEMAVQCESIKTDGCATTLTDDREGDFSIKLPSAPHLEAATLTKTSLSAASGHFILQGTSQLSRFASRGTFTREASAVGSNGEGAIEAARLNHLNAMLGKVQHKYKREESELTSQTSFSRSNSGRSFGPGYANLTKDAKRAVRKESRLTPKLPSYDKHIWKHLASQFHLSPEIVIGAARDIISPDYVMPSTPRASV